MAVALFFVAGCQSPEPALAPDAQMPPGAVLIYSNMGGHPVRVILVGECYITQEVYRGEWLVLNRGGLFGNEASIDCTSREAPELP